MTSTTNDPATAVREAARRHAEKVRELQQAEHERDEAIRAAHPALSRADLAAVLQEAGSPLTRARIHQIIHRTR